MRRRKLTSGFSLVDLVIGAAVIIIIFTVSARYVVYISQGAVNSDNQARASQKLRTAAENIYVQAGTNFFDMTATNQDRTGATDPNIKIAATIGGIDSATRSRNVQLVATWVEAGETKTKVMNFKVSQTRTLEGSSTVKVKVVDQKHPDVGTPGILVTATGADGNPVASLTDTSGVGVLAGVKTAGSGISVNLDGTASRCYFDLGGGDYSFSTQVQSGVTVAGQVDDSLVKAPVSINLPVKIFGKVTDITNGDPVGYATITLDVNNPIVNFSMSAAESTIKTAADGTYSFNKILPGSYVIWMEGNGAYSYTDDDGAPAGTPKYAALASMYDWGFHPYGWNNTLYVPTTGDLEHNFQTIKRGSLAGNVYGVTASGGQLTLDVAPASNVSLLGYRNHRQTYMSTDDSMIDLTQTHAFYYGSWYPDVGLKGEENETATSASDGSFIFPYITPKVVGEWYDLEKQYNFVWMRSDELQNLPFVPAMVIANSNPPWNPADIQILVTRNLNWNPVGYGYQMMPWNGPQTLPAIKVMTNALDNSVDPGNQKLQKAYVLNQSALSDIKGKISIDYGDGNHVPYTSAGDVMVLRADTLDPYGGFTCSGNKTYFNETNDQSSVIQSGQNTYSLGSCLARSLLPTVGNTQVRVKFASYSGGGFTNLSFFGSVSALKKVAATGNPAVDFVAVPSNEINITGLSIGGYEVGNGNPRWTVSLDVVNSQFQGNEPALHFGATAISSPISIPPGQDVPLDIVIYSSNVVYSRYLLLAGRDSDDLWSIDYWNSNSNGEFFALNGVNNRFEGTPLRLLKSVITGNIYGKVTDSDTGDPVLGATISIQPRGEAVTYMTSQAVAGPDGKSNYEFSSIKFIPFMNGSTFDATVTVNAPGYQPWTNGFNGYEGMTLQQDVVLSKIPDISGGGGGGGGL